MQMPDPDEQPRHMNKKLTGGPSVEAATRNVPAPRRDGQVPDGGREPDDQQARVHPGHA